MSMHSRFSHIKKSIQRSYLDGSCIESEVDWRQDGFNHLSSDNIRVQYHPCLVSATMGKVTIQDARIVGTPWNGYHYNEGTEMTAKDFLADVKLCSAYPEIAEFLSGVRV